MSLRPALEDFSPLPTVEQTSDEVLVSQARQNPKLFAGLYHRYQNRIYSYHFFRTCNPTEAEELTSETFLAALESLDHFDQRRTFCGWLFGIAQHKLADYFRKPDRNLPLETVENASTSDPSPEVQVARKLDMDAVARGLKHLPADQVEALSLRIFGGLSAAEAGRLMGKSEAAVKMLVLRGLRRLQQMLVLKMEVLKW
jgi:RNA polymerase sigma-70 factor (ECF subfamily)